MLPLLTGLGGLGAASRGDGGGGRVVQQSEVRTRVSVDGGRRGKAGRVKPTETTHTSTLRGSQTWGEERTGNGSRIDYSQD